MADTPESKGRAGGVTRKLLVPVAISAVGTLLGFLLSKKDRLREAAPRLRETVSDLPTPTTPGGAMGELTSDLKGKLDEVLGKEPAGDIDLDSGIPTEQDLSELEERRRARQERRRARQERRNRRRQRPRS
jgi:hypothetical protein